VTMALTEGIEDGGDDVRFLKSTNTYQIDSHQIRRQLRERPWKYELFDEIHLLSFEVSIEDWLLLTERGSSSGKNQRSAYQRLEEHHRNQ
jgi:hypothetical protein